MALENIVRRNRVRRPKPEGQIDNNHKAEYTDHKVEYIKNEKAKNDHKAKKVVQLNIPEYNK